MMPLFTHLSDGCLSSQGFDALVEVMDDAWVLNAYNWALRNTESGRLFT
jgi:hypothetical protein